MQVCHLIHQLPGTSCIPPASSSTAPHAAGFTLTYGQDCNIARAFVHVITLLPRPTCPLLGRTSSIKEGTVDDTDILSDVESSLFHTWHHL